MTGQTICVVKFMVLGPLVAVSDTEVPLDLGTPKARAVLAVLLCRPGRVVGIDSLVDALWPDAPPTAAVKNVQLYVHQLRRALGDAAWIRRQGSGYVLAAEPDDIDAMRFASLVEQHSAAMAERDLGRARALLAHALALWRAENAYIGLSEVPPVAAEARRLAEARLAALHSRIDIDLRLGRHGQLAPELIALTEEHPLDERFWAQLMISLHRSGRPSEALATYDRARRIIVRETGLDPGPELRHLQQTMLTGDDQPGLLPGPRPPWLDAPPRMLPPDVGDFTGRQSELATITATLAGKPEQVHGVVPIAALTGQGGVGKTALAVRAAHRLADTYRDGQLFANLAGAQPTPADPDEVLARLLRAMGVPGRAVPDTGEECGAMYRSLVSGRRILLVLDDAADEAQIRPLLPGAASCGVIVTSRTRLGGLPGARHIDLPALPTEDGYRLLAQIAGPARTDSDADATRKLVTLCAGLPLALRIAGSRLASRPHWSIGDLTSQLADERRRLDTLRHRDLEVRASFGLSYRGLGPAEQRLFRLLGLLEAPDMSRWAAAALLDATPEEAQEVLEALADARLLEVTGPDEAGQRRYRFHDLVRIYAKELAEADETADVRTAALGRVFAMLLSLSDAVRQADDGGDYGLIIGDASRWRAAEVAAGLSATARPLVLLRAERLSFVAATRQAATLGMDEASWELCFGASLVYQGGAYFDDWHETHRAALAAVQAAGNGRGEAVMLLQLASYHSLRRHRTEAREHLGRALELFRQIGERYGYALALRKLSQYERHAGRFDAAIARAREARDLLTALGDPTEAADCMVMEGTARFEIGDPVAADVLAEAVTADRAQGSWTSAAHGSYWLVLARLAAGRHDQAAAAAAELSELVGAIDDQIGAVYGCHARGSLACAEGDLDTARREFEAGLNSAREIRDPLMQVRILTSLGELYQAEAKHEEAVRLLTEAVAISEDLDGFPVPHIRALRRLGDARAAAGDPGGADAAWKQATAITAEIGAPLRVGLPLQLAYPLVIARTRRVPGTTALVIAVGQVCRRGGAVGRRKTAIVLGAGVAEVIDKHSLHIAAPVVPVGFQVDVTGRVEHYSQVPCRMDLHAPGISAGR